MKKLSIYGFAACMALAFAACDDYKEPNPPSQYNPQESILQASDVTVTAHISGGSYDLLTLNNNNGYITVATVECSQLPVGYTFGADAYISADGFASSYAVPVAGRMVEEGMYEITMSPDDLDGVYKEHVSHSPNAKELELRFLLTTVSGNQIAYVGGSSNYYGPYTFTVTPLPSTVVVEEAYYLLGTINGWDVATAVPFSHSDKSVYDDPVFTLNFEITEDQAAEGWWWKIVPQSTYVTGNWADGDYSQYGVAENGDSALSGMLVPKLNGNDPGAGCLYDAGQWMMTINLEESTYEITSAVAFLWTPGDANGWNQAASQQLYTNNYETYQGYAVLSPGGFKFTTAPDWDHTNYGQGEGEGELSSDGGAGNLTVETLGLYWCNVNIPALTYTTTYIETIGLIGDATPGGWDASTALTPSADYLEWKGEVYLTDGEFKFRANNGWDVNLGGDSYTDLTQDGPNLKSPGEGTYTVTLYLNELPYSCTVVKK